jgi:type II secretory pathway pseudopilin PulG
MRRAFTIIEILLVILIIVVLAGILFPVIASARGQGQLTTASSQMKQLGTAVGLYAADVDGNFVPSTNYGAAQSSPERIWAPLVHKYAKDKNIFVAPGSNGKFAERWSDRSWMTIGLNSATALKADGCREDQKDTTGCQGFRNAASFDKVEGASKVGLFAVTPAGELEQSYLGYEFSPYNGTPTDEDKIELTPPLVSDRDLVKLMPGTPAALLKPIHARYVSSGRNDGQTPVVFADGHGKNYSAKAILGNSGIVWRFR